MKLLHSLPPYNFGGIEETVFEKSRVVVLPVPFDSTTSYKSGAREGPHVIIAASRQLEWFDEEIEFEPVKAGIYTLPELEPSRESLLKTIDRIQKVVEEIVGAKKFPLMLGGEHSISLGAVRALKKKYGELSVLQFDAHADLRNEFEGTKYSHACIMRRVFEEKVRLVQIGLRSCCAEEWNFLKKSRIKTFFAKDKGKWSAKQVAEACGENVYITFDLDAFDPAIMPSTGTPEPGGLEWREAIQVIKEVSKRKNIVGTDVVELMPIPGLTAPDFLAAKLCYKIIAYSQKKLSKKSL